VREKVSVCRAIDEVIGMSMRPGREQEILAMTAAVARAAFPKGCMAVQVRDTLEAGVR